MKSACFLFALLAASQLAFALDEGFRPPTAAAVAVDEPPAIDGKLDDACWDEAIELSGFHVFGRAAPAKYPTAMMLVTARDSLYIALRCAKGKGPFKFAATPYMRDGDVFKDDSVEIFLQPDPTSTKYYQFVVNPLGSRYDGTGRDRSWDGEWKAAAAKTRTGWSLELAIPFATLGAGRPKPGEAWGFSVVRNEVAGGESSCWADLSAGFHDPANFGRLVFSEPLRAEPRLAVLTGDGMKFVYIAPVSAPFKAYGVKKPSKLAGAGRLNILNPSFETGLRHWSCEFPRRAYETSPVSIDRDVKASAGASLRIDSANPFAKITVAQKVVAPPGRFEVECLLRLSDTKGRGSVVLFVDQGAHGYRQNLAVEATVVGDELRSDGWIRRAVRFKVPSGCAFVRVGVEVSGFRGKVWVDGFTSRKVARPERPIDGIWYWDATWDADGMVVRKRLFKMMDEKSPFLERAQRFNDTLADAAFAVDDWKLLERALHYMGKGARNDFAARVNAIYGELDRVNRAYANAYVGGRPDELPRKVDEPLKKIASAVARLARDVHAELETLLPRGAKWSVASPERPFRIAPDGLPNQLIFGTWGKWRYRRLGRKLGVWKLTSNDGPDSPRTRSDGSLGWGHLLDYIDRCRKAGVTYYGVRTSILRGRDTYVSPGFAEANAERADFKIGRKWNLWRPEVIEEQKRVLASLARATKTRPEVLFNQFVWEVSGPQRLDESATDPKTSSGLASFQAFLRRTYGTIGALNRAWKTDYADFTKVIPAALTAEHADPLRYEYQRWRQESYIELLKSLYGALKKEDPQKPVLCSHTRLMWRIDPTRIFETCDLIDSHGPDKVPINLYLASNAPLAGKQVCKFENFWQYQEDTPHWGNERVQFAAMAKYVYRNMLMGMKLQFYCFPYTSQKGWNWRQAQWTQLATDYATLRHAACALPVAIRRVKRLERVFLKARLAPGRMLVVFPRTSFLHMLETPYNEMRAVVKVLHARGRSFAFRSEARIASGDEKLDDYRLIVLPRSPFLGDGVADKLLGWVKTGGTLITVGPAGVYDKYGFADGRLMRETVGVVPEPPDGNWRAFGPWRFGDSIGGPAYIDRKVAKGRMFIINMPFEEFLLSEDDGAHLFAAIEEGAPAPFRCEGSLFELWPLVTDKGERFLGVLNPNSYEDVTAEILLRADVNKVTDLSLADRFRVPLRKADGGSRFSLRLGPGGFALFRIEK